MTPRDPVEFRLFDTDLTSVIGILPAKSMNLFLLLNEPGSGEVSIPLNSRANSQIASDMFVETKYRGGVRGGFFVENVGKDFAKGGEVDSQVVSMSGRGALALLDDAIVWDDGTGASTRELTGTRAGILIELIEEAKTRGALLTLEYDFTATHDSDSEGWVDADDEPLILNVGTSYLEIVRRMAKVGTDFTMTPDGSGNYVLSAYKNGVGEDKSAMVYFRVGVNCEEVSSLETGGEIKNVLKVKYKAGFTQVKDDASISARRRREKIFDASYTARSDTAITFASAELQTIKEPKKQITLKIYDGAGPRVFVDYGLGDRVTLDIEGVEVDYRVRGLQLSWDGEKFATVVVDLNSIILENEIRMAQDIAYLMDRWNTARDANLLEVSFWANIGDPNISYAIADMLLVGSKLYVASQSNLYIYDITSGGWTRVALSYSANCLTNVGTDIYIGCFSRLLKYDGSTVTEIAQIDNTPNVEPPSIDAITAIGTNIYFGGIYTSVDSGALSTQEIVEYDTLTDTFTDIGGLVSPLDLINDGANLYACNASGVEMWNTSSWSALGSLTNVTCLALYGNNLLAGGSFTGKISEWDGATWTVLGGGVDGNVLAIATYLADIYVGGFITGGIKRYSGGLWWDLDGGTNDRVTDIIVSNGTVYVGGPFTQAGDKVVNEVAAYINGFESLVDYLENSRELFDLAAAIHNATPKTSMAANDEMGFWDSISQKLRKITWSNILLSIKTYTDGLYVALTGNQIVAGVKEFSSFPITPSSAPTADYEVANKKYVDDNSGGSLPTLDPDSVVITDASGDIITDPKALYSIALNLLSFGGNPLGIISTLTDAITFVANDGVSAQKLLLSYGTGVAGRFGGVTGRGTFASPTALQDGDVIARFSGRFHYDSGGTPTPTQAEIRLVVDGTPASGDYPTRLEFYTTPDGSSTMTLRMIIKNNGQLILGSYGIGTHTGTLSRLLGVSSTGDVIEVVKDSYPSLFEGRISLSSTLPNPTADLVAQGTIYLHGWKGNRISLYNSTLAKWIEHTIPSTPLSLAFSGLPTASRSYDLFVYDNSGTLTLEAVVWTDANNRATAHGYQDSIKVKSGDTSRRYVGSFYIDGSKQATMEWDRVNGTTPVRRHVWNEYNRVWTHARHVSTASHTHSSATYRKWNNGDDLTHQVVIGDLEEDITVFAGGQIEDGGNLDVTINWTSGGGELVDLRNDNTTLISAFTGGGMRRNRINTVGLITIVVVEAGNGSTGTFGSGVLDVGYFS